MERAKSWIMLTWLFLTVFFSMTFSIGPVGASSIIYVRPDGSIDPSTAPIQRDGNIYLFKDNINGSIVVEKDNIVIDAMGYTLQGTGAYRSKGISLLGRNNVTIRNVKIKAFDSGIYLSNSSNNSIHENNITSNNYDGIVLSQSHSNSLYGNTITNNLGGIVLSESSNNTIHGNMITNNRSHGIKVTASSNNSIYENSVNANTYYGIRLDESMRSSLYGNSIRNNHVGVYFHSSSSNALFGNIVTHNGDGVWLRDFANNNRVSENDITANYDDGIVLSSSSNNTIFRNDIEANNSYGIAIGASSNNNRIWGNNITSATNYGARLSYASNNLIYHNNFMNYPLQVEIENSVSIWDKGYPSGGNFWNNHTGVDRNQDGIGDSPHFIGANNQDNHPLMGMFSSFNTSLGHQVNVVSNVTVEGFEHFGSNSTIVIQVYAPIDQSSGFCRILVPHALLSGPYNVSVDGGPPDYADYNLLDNGTHTWIYFAYQHPAKELSIQGFPPPDTTPPNIFILSPENRTYRQNHVPLTMAFDESTSWIGYSLDGRANVTIGGNTTIASLHDGSHTLVLYANDTAGNIGASETVCFSIDTQASEEPSLPWILASTLIILIGGAPLVILFYKRRRQSREGSSEHSTGKGTGQFVIARSYGELCFTKFINI